MILRRVKFDLPGQTRRASPRSRRLAAAALLLLGSCTVGPDYSPPEMAKFDIESKADGIAPASVDAWWTLFADPTLDELVARARRGNRDLAASLLRIEAARAARSIARGDWVPSVDGVGAYERSRPSSGGFEAPAPAPTDPASEESAASTERPSVTNRNLTSIAIDASWEVDVFGRIRRSVESADANLEATVEDGRDLEIILLADVARTYFEVLTLRERLTIARANAITQEQTFELTKSRNAAQLSTALDVAQAESNLALTRAGIPSLEADHDAALFRLALLLGEAPGVIEAEIVTRELPLPPPLRGTGSTAEMLTRRPDVRAAERRHAAQVARIGIATADLYPRFSLTGGYGYESQDGSALLDSGNRTFFVGPSFRWSLFDGGRIRGSIDREDALARETRARFEATVLRALQEVETEWSAYRHETERTGHLALATRAAGDAANRVRDLYREGLSDFQNVLDAERVLFQVQDLHATSRGRVIEKWISVYRALGGGYSSNPAP